MAATCGTCHGTGSVTISVWDAEKRQNIGQVITCTVCAGTGQLG